MNITSASNFVSSSFATQGVQTPQVSGASDADGDGDGGGGARVHRSKGHGGQIQQALMQALQSLGLAAPQPAAAATPATASGQAPTSTDGDGDSDSATSGAGNVKQDMRQFIHALFQAVKSDASASTSATGAVGSGPKANFAAGLSALISQVSNGSAPSGLQSAFAKLASDLQASSSTTSTTGTASGTPAGAPQATLQALLTAVQQDLGYGATSASTAGNLMTASA